MSRATTNAATADIRIREDFRSLIPPLRSEELELLEAGLLRDGCRDPLVVWREEGILLDGHHRLEICRRHGIPFEVVEVNLSDEEAASDWIDQHQLGRRNLTPDQMSLLRGRRYNRAKRQGARTDLTSDQSDQKLGAADRLADEHGVSPPTIRRDGRYAAAVEKLEAAMPEGLAGVGARPKKAVITAAELWSESPELARAVLDGERNLAGVKRAVRHEAVAQRLGGSDANARCAERLDELVRAGRRFGTIYADPPWRYDNSSSRGAAGNHYGTLILDELRALPVAQLAGDESHLHLWATVPLLPEAIGLLASWEFEYRSAFVWTKPQLGLGNYWRISTELLLLGVRGRLPFAERSQRNWIELDRTKHSAKPGEIRRFIELVSPGPRLELFGRHAVPGWTVWGNEVAPEETPAGEGDPQ